MIGKYRVMTTKYSWLHVEYKRHWFYPWLVVDCANDLEDAMKLIAKHQLGVAFKPKQLWP